MAGRDGLGGGEYELKQVSTEIAECALIDGKYVKLSCQAELTKIDISKNYHSRHNCRHPYGIYNISTEKILRRLNKLIDVSIAVSNSRSLEALKETIIEELPDIIESVLYASSEHVDDIRLILDTFYLPEATSKTKASTRPFLDKLKLKKSQITKLANNLKHNHGRINIFTGELINKSQSYILVGFSCESYFEGGLGPNPIFHEKLGNIVSLSAFAWEHLLFLWDVSELLREFLLNGVTLLDYTELKEDYSNFYEVFRKLLEMPLYSFDEAHPIRGRKVRIVNDAWTPRAGKDLLGSIYLPWNKVDLSLAKPGRFSMNFRGDGSTKKFHLGLPRNLSLIHWEQFAEEAIG